MRFPRSCWTRRRSTNAAGSPSAQSTSIRWRRRSATSACAAAQELERPADHGEWRAELVAHGREELVLDLVRPTECLGLARLREEPVVLEDLRDEPGDRLGETDVVGDESVGQ